MTKTTLEIQPARWHTVRPQTILSHLSVKVEVTCDSGTRGSDIFFFFFCIYDSGFPPVLVAVVSWVAEQMGTLTSSFLVNSGDLRVSFTVCLHQRRPGAWFLLEGVNLSTPPEAFPQSGPSTWGL